MVVGFDPTPRAKGYLPSPAYSWAFDELSRLERSLEPDARLPVGLLDNIVDLAINTTDGSITKLVASLGDNVIDFNYALARSARLKRDALLATMPAPDWFAGISKGEVQGELRGVTDLEGEKEFFLKHQRGKQIKCIFTEEMRGEMNRLLFKTVRISGLLHYEGGTSHPTLMEAAKIHEIADQPATHMADMEVLFKDSYYPIAPRWPQ